MQQYLLPQKMPTQLAKFTFMCRTRMLPVGANFKAQNPNPLCPLCKVEYDSQIHLLFCPKLLNINAVCKEVPNYDDLFSQNVEKQQKIANILWENIKKREKLLKEIQS